MRVIAYYLPQYHRIKENDLWWGDGFTEWTNVKKGEALFKGHEQPKAPGSLGYYDLNNEQVREQQAQLAEEAGIEAFCYWHYWFGNGKQLLEMPFNTVLRSKKPAIKFCLGWANESWKLKDWSATSGKKDKVLIEQTYPGKEDNEAHFYSLLDAFKDERYVLVDEKPLFVIYRPFQLSDAKQLISEWNELAVKNGLKGIYFVGHAMYSSEIEKVSSLGFDAVTVFPLGDCKRNKRLVLKNLHSIFRHKLRKAPLVYNYKDTIDTFAFKKAKKENVFPSILPNWDHTPRSGVNGFVLHQSTPDFFKQQVELVFKRVEHKPKDKQIVFLKSWNEWGEGNYIEPDEKYGNAYLNVLKNNLNKK